MTKFALTVSYDGANYKGWQRQQHAQSVQATLEQALSRVANTPITVHCAGRTDTGVHATKQVIHFDTHVERATKSWLLGTNALLPCDIRVHEISKVPEHFHARFSAQSRRYCYVLYESLVAPVLLPNQVTWVRQHLNVDAMQLAVQCLLGEHNFSAFRASQCQSRSCHRHVQAVVVRRCGKFIAIEIEANAFLYHMVRNIVGSLLLIGEGKAPAEWLHELLLGADRRVAGPTASPKGLYLVNVTYPDEFGLVNQPMTPIFLPNNLATWE